MAMKLPRDPEQAECILVTTCAFKKEEEDNSMSLIDRLSQYNARVLVYGCLPDIAPTRFKENFAFDYLSPRKINEIDNLFDNVRYKFADITDSNVINSAINHSSWPDAIEKFKKGFDVSVPFMLRSMRFVKNKVLDTNMVYYLFTSRGCLGSCSYCAVRFAVGTVKSKPIPTILEEFRRGIDSGYKNFIMLGDDVGAYGQDCNGQFPELLSALIAELEELKASSSSRNVRRGRINLHIDELNPRWILQFRRQLAGLVASRYVKSLLCPIQSGNDRILRLMNREHDIESIIDALAELCVINPKLQLNSQIIVGFPSETEEEFDDTLHQLARIKFDTVTIFPYDEKEKTKAVEIHPKITEPVIRQRVAKAHKYLRNKGIKTVLSCNE